MMDRELLELAAKANGDFYTHPDNKIPDGLPVIFYLDGKQWNPLTDDGDALRLAVKLSMNVYVNAGFLVSAEITNDSDEPSIVANEYGKQDPYAATRRAVVRAAAEIGKTL